MQKFVDNNIENMKRDLAVLVSHNSVFSDDAKPFGKENRNVLEDALKLMDKYGLKTNNLDYYCGYGECGQGDKVIGVVSHLDIVPAGDGWDSDPFSLNEKDGYLYGRGVSDDKGAFIASLYALKYLIDTKYPFKKRVRLIAGCNEETGSRCISYYVSKEGHIDLGFTPDANFPGIFAEKGIFFGYICAKNSRIIDIYGGEASNIVNKKVTCVLPKDSYNKTKLDQYFTEHKLKYELDNDTLTVHGKAAHASTPDLGINAINHLMEALYYADFKDQLVEVFHKYIGLTNHGEKMNFESLKDEYTDTSINIGVASKKDGVIKLSLDMRFPVKTNSEECNKLIQVLNNGDVYFECGSGHEPLFFDVNSPMIKALYKAYQDVTGDKDSKMQAIGGGTYAKTINNCIAFGCEFFDEENHIHDANEKLNIEAFKKQVLIYIEAIKNLNEVEL